MKTRDAKKLCATLEDERDAKTRDAKTRDVKTRDAKKLCATLEDERDAKTRDVARDVNARVAREEGGRSVTM